MDEDVVFIKLNEAISEAINLFQKQPYFFLNEHDVQAFLYNKIQEKISSDKNGLTTFVHCEMSLDKSADRPDISICDTKTFSTNKKGFDYHFGEVYEILELKCCVSDGKSDVIKKIKEDYNKLCKLTHKYNSQAIIFDHKDHLELNEIIKIQKDNNDINLNIKIIYVSPKKIICVANSKKCDLFDDLNNES